MPTYEYECRQCGGQFEYLQSIVAPPMEKCETCGGPLTKLISAGTGLIFKGSGFYITDYKSPGAVKGDSGSGSSSGEKKNDGGGEKKSESASGASSESKSSDSAKNDGATSSAAPAKKAEGA